MGQGRRASLTDGRTVLQSGDGSRDRLPPLPLFLSDLDVHWEALEASIRSEPKRPHHRHRNRRQAAVGSRPLVQLLVFPSSSGVFWDLV